MSQPVSAVVVGAGGRGTTYALFAKEHPERLKIVGVAEPRDFFRSRLVEEHDIPPENVFHDWREMAARPRLADAVIIATQDNLHADPAVAFAGLKYAMLLEKPMAPSEAECTRIWRAAKDNGILFGVCHVLRYTSYTQALKAVLDSGEIGEVISVQHLEPVGYWHQAHSFVRGNWRNEAESSSMLLAKSCHDLDWLRYVVGTPCRSLSSFGALTHFTRTAKPQAAGAAKRCLECAYEPECPYSARKIYLGSLERGATGWPVNVVDPDPTAATLTAALQTGPYGRCVYECDNDVVDHQVVNMLFDGPKTAAFTMTAFNRSDHRQTRIFGTRGEILCNGVTIRVFDFLTDEMREVGLPESDGTLLGGHGGGDYGLMERFTAAVAAHDQRLILSGPDESLETHRMVFAAERARREHRVVDLSPERPLTK